MHSFELIFFALGIEEELGRRVSCNLESMISFDSIGWLQSAHAAPTHVGTGNYF